jgi:uncharacterized protein (TIGR00369 family)
MDAERTKFEGGAGRTEVEGAAAGAGARTRTFSWEDPAAHLGAISRMSGLEALRAVAEGRLPPPPIARLMGMGMAEVGEGFVAFTCEAREWHYNLMGMAHGGLSTTTLDSAMGCAVHTTLAPGEGYATLELKVNLLRKITTATGPLRIEGRVVAKAGRTAVAEGKILDAAGALYAWGSTTCAVFPARAQAGG